MVTFVKILVLYKSQPRSCKVQDFLSNFMAKNLQHLENFKMKSLFGDRALTTKNVFFTNL